MPIISIFRFGDFELDGRSRELRKRGRRLRVQQQPLHILTMLVETSGEVVTREELRERIWGTRTHVDFDRAINKADHSPAAVAWRQRGAAEGSSRRFRNAVTGLWRMSRG